MSNDDLIFPGYGPAVQVWIAAPEVKTVLSQKSGHEPASVAGASQWWE